MIHGNPCDGILIDLGKISLTFGLNISYISSFATRYIFICGYPIYEDYVYACHYVMMHIVIYLILIREN